MAGKPVDENISLMLDGNAVAGLLYELIDVDMTVASLECASCGRHGEMGSLWALVESPGYVLCCPDWQNIFMRMTVTPDQIYLDVRGAAHLRIPKRK